jgi:hypothetical protein
MVAVNPETSVIELQNTQGIAVGQLQAGAVSNNARKNKYQTKTASESGHCSNGQQIQLIEIEERIISEIEIEERIISEIL